jgi:hypothetical protein
MHDREGMLQRVLIGTVGWQMLVTFSGRRVDASAYAARHFASAATTQIDTGYPLASARPQRLVNAFGE